MYNYKNLWSCETAKSELQYAREDYEQETYKNLNHTMPTWRSNLHWIQSTSGNLNLSPRLLLDCSPEVSEGNEEEMKTFNEDIVCSHGMFTWSMFTTPAQVPAFMFGWCGFMCNGKRFFLHQEVWVFWTRNVNWFLLKFGPSSGHTSPKPLNLPKTKVPVRSVW